VSVPTDVVPYYSKIATRTLDVVVIPWSLVSSDGDAVTLEIQENYGQFEIVPGAPLQPNTEYTLSATLNTEWDGTGDSLVEKVTFTTGAGPYDGVPLPPDASLTHYRFDDTLSSSCSPWESGTCVAFGQRLPVVGIYIDEFGQELHPALHTAAFFTNLSGVDQGTNFDCVQLRTRAPNGALSEPTELCRDDGPLYTLDRDEEDIACTTRGLEQGGELVTDDTSGCSITAAGRPASPLGMVTAALLAAACLARRRTSSKAPHP
jgi:hypothetical protein